MHSHHSSWCQHSIRKAGSSYDARAGARVGISPSRCGGGVGAGREDKDDGHHVGRLLVHLLEVEHGRLDVLLPHRDDDELSAKKARALALKSSMKLEALGGDPTSGAELAFSRKKVLVLLSVSASTLSLDSS